jgi:hypothetical protein
MNRDNGNLSLELCCTLIHWFVSGLKWRAAPFLSSCLRYKELAKKENLDVSESVNPLKQHANPKSIEAARQSYCVTPSKNYSMCTTLLFIFYVISLLKRVGTHMHKLHDN